MVINWDKLGKIKSLFPAIYTEIHIEIEMQIERHRSKTDILKFLN